MAANHLPPLEQLLAWAEANKLDDSGLARYLDVTPQNIYNWKKRGRLPDSQLIRVANLTGLVWEALQGDGESLTKEGTYPHGVGRPHTILAHEASQKHFDTPIIGWEKLMSVALPPKFKVVLEDTSLAPRLSPGDELVFERRSDACAGKIALIRHPSGVHVVRWLREKLPGQFVAYASNPGFEPFGVDGEQIKVVGICTEVRIMNPTIQSL